MARVAGVDGCRAGWLRLERDDPSKEVIARVFSTADALFRDAALFAVLTIDIPIGLPDSGARACDIAARRYIQPRGSSVFPVPVRPALGTGTYAEACEKSIAASGKSLSQQAFAILPKIREVDSVLRGSDDDIRSRIREVHPEVCFRMWHGQPLAEPKKSGLGFAMRLRLVESCYPGQFELVRRETRRQEVADDDILDAFAALWTAERVVRGAARIFPDDNPPMDSAGLRMEMLA